MVSLPSSVTSVNRDMRIGEEDSEYGERKACRRSLANRDLPRTT